MHLPIVPFISLVTAAAAADWWYFDAWDGVGCGDLPQNGEIFSATEGVGSQVCISFSDGTKAYSYAGSHGEDQTEIWGYLDEHCTGPSKPLLNNTCTNPEISIPYIRSWKVIAHDS
ncbi:hypothetical protein N7456_007750 [Penicillium angulare]|uniref:Uncharacterized protein n=1 Tax=Penicillium angulare TaxID=116970 RepID=A0A9W9FBC0_9EURO|nr:hypothetical protein N7456_007750 [Penicillium angulare]